MPITDVNSWIVKDIASKKSLEPVNVKGIQRLRIARGVNARAEVIDRGASSRPF